MRFELDPTSTKVAVVGVLLFLESLLGSLLLILEQNQWPELIQFVKSLFVALLVVVTYVLTFLRKDET